MTSRSDVVNEVENGTECLNGETGEDDGVATSRHVDEPSSAYNREGKSVVGEGGLMREKREVISESCRERDAPSIMRMLKPELDVGMLLIW